MSDFFLFDYQKDMLERVLQGFRAHRTVMAQMPTGTGKTYLLAAIVREFLAEHGQKRVMIVAHRRELVEQISATCERFELADSVCVKSIQWLNLHLDGMRPPGKKNVAKEMGMIVIDEAHHALAKTYRTLWENFPQAKILGLTATPYRLNGSGFYDLFEVLVTSLSVREFIRMKRLSLFDYVSIKGDSEEQRLVDSLSKRGADGDYQVKEMGAVLNNKPAIERLFQTFSKYALHKKGIVYAININHAKAIADFYCKHGIEAVVIDSKTPSSLRKELIERFKTSSFIQVLVNVDIFSEGFDCPDVEVVQLARPTLSLAKYLQMVGRGLRVAEGKKCCTIIDNVGLYRAFGLPSADWDWQRIFLGWKRKELQELRTLNVSLNPVERFVNEDIAGGIESEVGMVMNHEILWKMMQEGEKDSERYEVRQDDEKRRLLVLDSWNDGKVVVDIFCNQAKYDRRGMLINAMTNYKHWDAIDLLTMWRYPVGSFPSAKVCYWGNISLLKINSRYITRTQKHYACVFPISEQDVEWHSFYLLIHDPQSPRPMPVCVLANDNTSYYWWVADLNNGGICVMDDDEHFFFVYLGKEKVRVSREKGWSLMPSDEELRDAADEQEQGHEVKVVKVGCKFALYVDKKMVVPPIYRRMELAEHGFCKVQVRPQQWGLITLLGKVVVPPDFADVKVINSQKVRTITLAGKENIVRI